ncbi:bifunctional diguanylate cyclase/phosphodiesterase [Roseomonas sp. AR75]|uniref:putative bifunctional diguanylate cyclase/phosphodiesterase n=1 Tax=Roseomonas sp. AR75 TaxID=2562311 RepID=UPI0010C0096C|nr:bifunctional diguanylate cyclase/phosphodiesterase [Roseomonas sp. AR75]
MAGPLRDAPARRPAPMLGLAAAALLLGAVVWALARNEAPASPAQRWAGPLLLLGLAALPALLLLRRMRAAGAGATVRQDPLTGLLSHAGLRARLEETLALSRRRGCKLGMLVLNLRQFRDVNAARGRASGDAVLCVLAGRLQSAVRQEDAVARLSGDRFAVVQSGLQDPADAPRLAERLAALIAEPVPMEGALLRIAADIGIAIGPDDADDACMLLTRAEDALAAARAEPAPAISCFAPERDAALRQAREMERELGEAIAAGQFQLHWQPQRRLTDGHLIGFEALLRWNHPTRGMVPPDAFIPLAESSGLIVPLGAWVIRTATMEAAAWPGGLKAAVNLSAVQVRAEGLLEMVAEALEASGLPAHRLELEVTESVLMQDGPQAAKVITGLQALGVSVALDDFGTGWSSLAYLRRFAFDELKIDRQFLRDLEADPRVEAVVTAILGMGRGLGMRVVAEGVETREQADRLLALGCERGQGWLLGRPMPVDQARALISAETSPALTA